MPRAEVEIQFFNLFHSANSDGIHNKFFFMKKLIMILTLIPLFLYFSCNSDTPPKPLKPDAPISDPVAAAQTFLSIVEACPYCVFNLPATVSTAVFSAIIGADASGAFGRASNTQNTFGKNSNIFLDSIFQLSENPYEDVGITHNKVLNYLNKQPDLFLDLEKLKNYDNFTWNEVLTIASPNSTDSEKDSVIEILKESNIFSVLENSAAFFNPEDIDPFKTYLEHSSFSLQKKTEIFNIVNNYKELLNTESKTDELEYINKEILQIVRPENGYSNEEIGELIFLTVLKHSTYYWNDQFLAKQSA